MLQMRREGTIVMRRIIRVLAWAGGCSLVLAACSSGGVSSTEIDSAVNQATLHYLNQEPSQINCLDFSATVGATDQCVLNFADPSTQREFAMRVTSAQGSNIDLTVLSTQLPPMSSGACSLLLSSCSSSVAQTDFDTTVAAAITRGDLLIRPVKQVECPATFTPAVNALADCVFVFQDSTTQSECQVRVTSTDGNKVDVTIVGEQSPPNW
jgi:hypothetical protein